MTTLLITVKVISAIVFCVFWVFFGLDLYEKHFGFVPDPPRLKQYPILTIFGGPLFLVLMFCLFLEMRGASLKKKIIDWQNS